MCCVQATAVEGMESSISTDYIMKVRVITLLSQLVSSFRDGDWSLNQEFMVLK